MNVLKYLIEQCKSDVMSVDYLKRNVLHLACIFKHDKIVSYLKVLDEELKEMKDDSGKRPFDYYEPTREEQFEREKEEERETEADEGNGDEGKGDEGKRDVHDQIVERKNVHSFGGVKVSMIEDEVLDMQGSSSNEIEKKAEFLLNASEVEVMSTSLSTVYIPSQNPKNPGRIKRTLLIIWRARKHH